METPSAHPVLPGGRLTGNTTGPRAVASVAVEFPPHRHSQDDAIEALADFGGQEFRRFAAGSGVATRQLALRLSRYPQLSGFTEANNARKRKPVVGVGTGCASGKHS